MNTYPMPCGVPVLSGRVIWKVLNWTTSLDLLRLMESVRSTITRPFLPYKDKDSMNTLIFPTGVYYSEELISIYVFMHAT